MQQIPQSEEEEGIPFLTGAEHQQPAELFYWPQCLWLLSPGHWLTLTLTADSTLVWPMALMMPVPSNKSRRILALSSSSAQHHTRLRPEGLKYAKPRAERSDGEPGLNLEFTLCACVAWQERPSAKLAMTKRQVGGEEEKEGEQGAASL